jgi:hypothetical protein
MSAERRQLLRMAYHCRKYNPELYKFTSELSSDIISVAFNIVLDLFAASTRGDMALALPHAIA